MLFTTKPKLILNFSYELRFILISASFSVILIIVLKSYSYGFR